MLHGKWYFRLSVWAKTNHTSPLKVEFSQISSEEEVKDILIQEVLGLQLLVQNGGGHMRRDVEGLGK